MTAGDLEWALALDRRTPTAPHWSRAMYESLLKDEAGSLRNHLALVAEDDGAPCGFAIASLLLDGVENACELELIVVDEALRRRGIGRALLDQTLVQSAAKRARRVLLEVRAGNAAALRLYGAAGFTETRRRRDYYDDPPEDAVEMQKVIPAVENPDEKGIEGGPHEC